jgi:WS/DGAT/MGAT family acyltransferase
MTNAPLQSEREPLTPEDLNWWYGDQPRQRNTMAMLMLLDRRPDPDRLRSAALRACQAVPRLRQRIVDAPLGLAFPRWEDDPTFDLHFHIRRYSLHGGVAPEDELDELFHSIGPIYERPFDRTRPLWELIEIDLPRDRSAIFFRLHHSVADGVGANAVLAALTDADRAGEPLPPQDSAPPGAWPEPHIVERFAQALRDRAADDLGRVRGAAGMLFNFVRSPSSLIDLARGGTELTRPFLERSNSHLRSYGRARRLGGIEVPFEPLRAARKRLGGSTIDVLLTAVAGAMGAWHRQAGRSEVESLLTTVPINLRARSEQGLAAGVGNQLTAILLRLPIAERDPSKRFEAIRAIVEERKAHPAADLFPAFSHMLAALPRPLFRAATLASTGAMDLIVTNIPGIPMARYIAGSEISGAYPIAPTVPHCPVSIAFYGYRDRLYVGLDADGTSMPDLDDFAAMLAASLEELIGVDPA